MNHNPFTPHADDGDTFEVNGEVAQSIEPGDYHVTLIDVEKTESKAGNAMFAWTFRVTAAVKGSVDVSDAPDLMVYTALTDKAMWKVEETLAALKLGTSSEGRIVAKFTRKEAIGRKCVASVILGEYQGRTKIEIKTLRPE